MAAGEQQVRPPEWVLEEAYRIGRQWLAVRARERRHGLPMGEATAGDSQPVFVEPAGVEGAMQEGQELRRRFQSLVDEFIERVERE